MTNKIDPLVDVRSGYRVTTTINDNNRKIEAALENTVSLDGSTPNEMQAPLDLGHHKLLNVAAGTTAADAVNKAQLDSLGENLPQSTIDQIATRVAAIIIDGGTVTPPGGYTNPPAPTAVTIGNVLFNSVPISWTMSSTTWAEGYTITRNGVALPPVRGGSTLTFTDTTVQPNTSYDYAVSAYNDSYAYDSAYTSASRITTPSNTTVVSPGTPTAITATVIGPYTVQVTWTYNSTAPVDYFYILRNGSDLTAVTGDKRSAVWASNPPDTYNFSVVGVNSGYGRGTASAGATLSVTAPTPGTPVAPTSVAVTAVTGSTTSLTVSWVHGDNLHNGFIVSIDGPNGFFNEFSISDKATRTYTITGLLPTTSYSVIVSSFTVTGTTVASYPATAVVGTTNTGTVPTALTWALDTDFTPTGIVGTNFATTTTPLQTAGGVAGATKTFVIVSGPPSWLQLNSVTGAWIGSNPTATTNQIVNVAVTDGVNVLQGAFTITVAPTALVVTPPSGVSPGDTIVATGGTSFSKTWTATGGTAPYTVIVNGVLPTSITVTTTTPSAVIAGNSSQAFSNAYSINVDITSADGQNFNATYTIQFNSNVAANSPPVFGAVTSPNTFVRGTAYASMNAITSSDPDGQTPTLVLEKAVLKVAGSTDTDLTITGPTSNVYTITGTGITFTRSGANGTVAGTYTSTYDNTTVEYTISADDGIGLPLTASCDLPTLYTIGVSIPTGKKITATGGTSPYTYTLNSGTMPTWLGNAVNSSTGVITGATGAITAGTTTFVLRATDSAGSPAHVDVSVTIEAVAASTNDFVSRVTTGGYLFATDFQKVFINGVQDTTRTITSQGTAGNFGSSYKTTMFGQSVGGTGQSHVTWVDDPTGWQTKVARFTPLKTDTASSGTLTFFIDGHLAINSIGGTVYRKVYTMCSFFGTRDYFAYRDPTYSGDMKLAYIGRGFIDGATLIFYNNYTGFFEVACDNEGTNSIPPINKHWPNIDNPHILPVPNPWASTVSTADGQIYQQAGQWSEASPYPQTAVGTRPTGTTQADKDAYYTYYGFLDGSGVGLRDDTTGYGVTGVNGSGVVTPFMDERVHMRNGMDKGWPDSDAKTFCPAVGIGQWNYLQLMHEFDATGHGFVAGWHCIAGQPWRLIAANSVRIGTSAEAIVSNQTYQIMLYGTTRLADPNRPETPVDYGEVITSTTPIAAPGGFLPPFNRG